jgi:prepilin signal peptidase PulO-like enzyme (type II secretory pathway)
MMALTIGLFVYLLGLCVGSFLNVVVYRLPRGLSISEPTWSFCPHCRTTLQWYDNLPVLSWLLLRARCRYCGKSISPQYPLVEAATGLAFVLTYYLLFVIDARVLRVAELGTVPLAAGWPTDFCLLLAWLVLVAVLIVCSAMDLILYVVDTRVTDVALGAGIVLYALWPRPEFFAERAASPAAAAAVLAFVVSGVMLWRTSRRAASSDEQPIDFGPAAAGTSVATATPADKLAAVAAIIAFIGLAAWLLVGTAAPAAHKSGAFSLAVPAAVVALFIAMVLTGGQPRDVDGELRAAIEAEAPGARRVVLGELLWLLPALLAAIITYFVVRYVPAVRELWEHAISWAPAGRITPLGGITFAIYGAIVAAAAGWIIRIFFTLAFGREAFGTGDIYILAAAGAVGGWDIALLGFLLSVPIALAGWIVSLVLKRTGMIPFGPPLAIGFLVALWLNQEAATSAATHCSDLAIAWQNRPEIVLLGIGMLLVVLPVSIVLARLTRRLVEPQE